MTKFESKALKTNKIVGNYDPLYEVFRNYGLCAQLWQLGILSTKNSLKLKVLNIYVSSHQMFCNSAQICEQSFHTYDFRIQKNL